MVYKVEKNYEFYEILNTFPFLKDRVLEFDINPDEVEPEISLNDFLINKKKYSIDEVEIFLKKLNFDIKYYFKHGKIPSNKISKKEGKLLVLMEEE